MAQMKTVRKLRTVFLLTGVLALTGCDFSTSLPQGDGKNIYVEDFSSSAHNNNPEVTQGDGLDLAFEEYHLSNSAGGQVMVRYTNWNSWAVNVTTDFCFYGKSGRIQSVDCQTNSCLGPGESWIEVFESREEFSDYSCDYTMSRAAEYRTEEKKGIVVKTSTDDQGRVGYLVSSPQDARRKLRLYIYFFDDNEKLIAYDTKTVSAGGSGSEGYFEKPQSSYSIYAIYWKME